MIKSFFEKILILLSLSSVCSCMGLVSSTKVINGIETSEYPAVVKIDLTLSNSDTTWCSAGVISDNTLLTAAHCLADISNANNISLTLNGKTVTAKKFLHHPKYIGGAEFNPNEGTYDLGVVVFEDKTFSDITPLTVPNSIPSLGTPVRLVGYGCFTKKVAYNSNNYYNSYSSYSAYNSYNSYIRNRNKYNSYNSSRNTYTTRDSGMYTIECDFSVEAKKRTGTTKISTNPSYCAANMIELLQDKAKVDTDSSNATGEDTDTAPGDSGSPVLLESDHSKLIGVTSYGGTEYEDNKPSCYANPLYSENVSFLHKAITSVGAKIPWLESNNN